MATSYVTNAKDVSDKTLPCHVNTQETPTSYRRLTVVQLLQACLTADGDRNIEDTSGSKVDQQFNYLYSSP